MPALLPNTIPRIKMALLPFLRRTCILARALGRVEALTTPLPSTFAGLLEELQFPPLRSLEAVMTPSFGNLLQMWLSAPQTPEASDVVARPLAPVQLVSLPRSYCEVFGLTMGLRCPSTGEPMRRVAMCMACGTCVCEGCFSCANLDPAHRASTAVLGTCRRHMVE